MMRWTDSAKRKKENKEAEIENEKTIDMMHACIAYSHLGQGHSISQHIHVCILHTKKQMHKN